jgi:hypothetical protein
MAKKDISSKYGGSVLLFFLIVLLTNCTARKGQRVAENIADINDARELSTNKELKKSFTDVVFAGRNVFFAILKDEVFLLGSLEIKGPPLIHMTRVASRKELYILDKKFRELKRGSSSNNLNVEKELMKEFRIANILDIEEQTILLETMRESMKYDGRERGCFVKIIEGMDSFEVIIENEFHVGKKDEINFSFRLKENGALSLTDAKKNVIIATVHSHDHNEGLSGINVYGMAEVTGDASSVRLTGIPWITIGLTANHGGYLDRYDKVQVEALSNSENIVLYALFRAARKL